MDLINKIEVMKYVMMNTVSEYNNEVPYNKKKIILGPETFNNKQWQTNEPFCASWCLFFMAIVLLNPKISMINIYELFKIEQEEMRYLLLYRFLFWFCNLDEYKTNEYTNNKRTYMANQFISSKELNNTLTEITKDNIIINPNKIYYYCKSFVIHGQPYINGNVKMLKHVYEYKDNLTNLSFIKCSFTKYDIFVLLDLYNLTKLSIIQCNYSFVPSSMTKIKLPIKLVELEMRNNDFDEAEIINNLPESVKYVCTDFKVYSDIINFFQRYNNKILRLVNEPKELTAIENAEIEKVIAAKNHVFIRSYYYFAMKNKYFYFYKNPDEPPNYCFNCQQNNGIDFDNEIEEKQCVKCKKYLENENRKIKF